VDNIAARLIQELHLAPHPEGGYFRETYRSTHSTAIYYLLSAGEVSQWHRLGCDEIWHFYLGDGLLLRQVDLAGDYQEILLGTGPGEVPQVVIPAYHWQAAVPRGSYALMGCTVSPPFTWETFELGDPHLICQ